MYSLMCTGIFLDGEYKDKNAKFSFSCDPFMAKVPFNG